MAQGSHKKSRGDGKKKRADGVSESESFCNEDEKGGHEDEKGGQDEKGGSADFQTFNKAPAEVTHDQVKKALQFGTMDSPARVSWINFYINLFQLLKVCF